MRAHMLPFLNGSMPTFQRIRLEASRLGYAFCSANLTASALPAAIDATPGQ
jgi:hypothetical protein